MKVTLYTTPNCGNCNVIKQLLKAKQVEVTEVSLMDDIKLLEQVQASGVRSMPILSVADNQLSTWQRIMEAISNFIMKKARLVLDQVELTLEGITGYTYFSLQPQK